ncbi:MAG: hypothetical protein ACFE0R_04110 [Salinarimonas sp.]
MGKLVAERDEALDIVLSVGLAPDDIANARRVLTHLRRGGADTSDAARADALDSWISQVEAP